MRYVKGESRSQTTLFPQSLDEYVDENHPIRVIDAFINRLDVAELGFSKATTAETGRKPYNPKDLLKLFVYGYLNQVTSTRRLEKECHRNVEVMWLLGRLAPDFKTIADFRRENGAAIKSSCKAFIVFCKQAGLVSGQLVAIDGSKFRAAASRDQALTRKQLDRQIKGLEQRIQTYINRLNDDEAAVDLDGDRVQAALDYLQEEQAQLKADEAAMEASGREQYCRTEPEATIMRSGRDGKVLGYNAQSAVDPETGLIVAHDLVQDSADNRQLSAMVDAVEQALDDLPDEVLADAGYSNGEQIAEVQDKGIEVGVPANRATNNRGGYQREAFAYDEARDVYICPAGELLKRTTKSTKDKLYLYSRQGCNSCALQSKCTKADKRWVSRHFFEDALNKADQHATPGRMIRRMASVEAPFGTLKRFMTHGRFRCWGKKAASGELSLGVLSYNLMRATNLLGVPAMLAAIEST